MIVSHPFKNRSRNVLSRRSVASLASNPIVLYDIPSKGRCTCWSPNVWKTRLVLNYKQIAYKTEWLEYPDIKKRLASLGIPPNPYGSWSEYACPAVLLPDGEHIMGSLKINERLEALYPQPSLNLQLGLHRKVLPAIGKAVNAARPMILPAIWRNVLREPSASYFAEDRRRRFGQTLDEYERDEGGDVAWAAAKQGLESLRLELASHKEDDSPFLLGSAPSYGDFLIAAIFTWLEIADKAVYAKFVGYDPSFTDLHEACRPWLQGNDR